MSSQEKATARLERMYGKGAIYVNVWVTRSTSEYTHKVQAILGRWKDVGVGNSEEEATQAAAEALIERISDSITPELNKNEDLKKINEQLVKRLKKLQLALKEFGVEAIDRIADKIRDNQGKISPFETIELVGEAVEILAKFGIKLITKVLQREKEVGVSVTIDSENDMAVTVVEFDEDENAAQLEALVHALYIVRGRLLAEIREIKQADAIVKEHEERVAQRKQNWEGQRRNNRG